MVRVEVRRDPDGGGGAEPQIDVIPKDGGITAAFCEGTGDHLSVTVALDDLKIGSKRGIGKGILGLTEPTTNIWNNAALSKLASGHISAKPRCSTDVFPKAENLACTYLDSIQLIH